MSGRTRRALAVLAALGLLLWSYRFFFAGSALAGRDIFRLAIPDCDFLLESIRHRWLPLWNPYPRLGQPFAATLQSQAFYPVRWLALIPGSPVRAPTLEQMFHVVIAGSGTFAACRRLGASFVATFVSSVAFALGPMFLELALVPNVLSALAWSGWILATAIVFVRTPSYRRAGAFALALALSFLAGSPEIWLWQALIAATPLGWTRAPIRRWAVWGLSMVWGLAIAGAALLPGLELARLSGRDEEVIGRLTWSVSPSGLLSMGWMLADIPKGEYWQDNYLAPTLHIGALTCAFALLAVVAGRRRSARWLGALAVLLALLSLGSNSGIATWLLQHPPLKFFRFPAKYALGAAFLICVLASQGLDRAAALARRLRPSARKLALASTVSASLSAAGFTLAAYGPMRAAAKAGFIASFPWVMIAVIFFFVLQGPVRSRRIEIRLGTIWIVSIIVALRVLPNPLWLQVSKLETPSPIAQRITSDPNTRTSVIEGGADEEEPGPADSPFIERSRESLTPLRFVEERKLAVEGYATPEILRYSRLFSQPRRSVYDLAGARYFVRRRPPFSDLRLTFDGGELPSLYQSDRALPRAFIVQRAEVTTDAQALELVRSSDEPFRETAFLSEGAPAQSTGCDGSQARIVSQRPGRLEILAQLCDRGYLVLSDQYYPGWRAMVDSVETPIHRADYLIRAVALDKGSHQVVFEYRPLSFSLGAAVSALGVLLLLSTLIVRATGVR